MANKQLKDSMQEIHFEIIRALSDFKEENIYYIICSTGARKQYLENLAFDSGVSNRVIFAGRQEHETAMELAHAVDVGALPSLIEGLGLSGIEILAAGKPLIASNVHGIKDYVIDGKTAILCHPHNIDAFKHAISKMYLDKQFNDSCCNVAQNKALEFDKNIVRKMMEGDYRDKIRS